MQQYKIKKLSTADLVCEKIQDFIVDKTWAAGMRIPSENELAQQFGVNRLTVRIAIQRLYARGILDIRVGDGTYVCAFALDEQISDLSKFYVTEETVENSGEYCALLLTGCVGLAAERRTEEEADSLKTLCGAFCEACGKAEAPGGASLLAELAELFTELCGMLCAMSHNDLISYAFSLARMPLKEKILQAASASKEAVRVFPLAARSWKALGEAVSCKNAERASVVLREMMEICAK